ncbi:type III secretion system protein PrgR [Enterococcus faecium]|uniref:type III secretion system protein PrgR n=1 Tax=Enterococcus faecium TaxID=1352 RepID=UPI000B720700|nr:type III secretion system protein PrgR [Enterococcus faecium]OTO49803.1 hypothetical protein A5814_002891 [Enterococcus faecium]
MELKPKDLNQITCEFILFNRQHIKYSNRTIKRKITDFTGKEVTLYAKKLTNEQEIDLFFRQIKSIYFDGKVVACRGCSELPLIISNQIYSKMKARQRLLKESMIRYRELQKEERGTQSRKMLYCSKGNRKIEA